MSAAATCSCVKQPPIVLDVSSLLMRNPSMSMFFSPSQSTCGVSLSDSSAGVCVTCLFCASDIPTSWSAMCLTCTTPALSLLTMCGYSIFNGATHGVAWRELVREASKVPTTPGFHELVANRLCPNVHPGSSAQHLFADTIQSCATRHHF